MSNAYHQGLAEVIDFKKAITRNLNQDDITALQYQYSRFTAKSVASVTPSAAAAAQTPVPTSPSVPAATGTKSASNPNANVAVTQNATRAATQLPPTTVARPLTVELNGAVESPSRTQAGYTTVVVYIALRNTGNVSVPAYFPAGKKATYNIKEGRTYDAEVQWGGLAIGDEAQYQFGDIPIAPGMSVCGQTYNDVSNVNTPYKVETGRSMAESLRVVGDIPSTTEIASVSFPGLNSISLTNIQEPTPNSSACKSNDSFKAKTLKLGTPIDARDFRLTVTIGNASTINGIRLTVSLQSLNKFDKVDVSFDGLALNSAGLLVRNLWYPVDRIGDCFNYSSVTLGPLTSAEWHTCFVPDMYTAFLMRIGGQMFYVVGDVGASQASPSTAVPISTKVGSNSQQTPTATSGAAQPVSGTVLYLADWSSGLSGWSGGSDWKVVADVLTNDGSCCINLFSRTLAPFESPGTDYAVEAEIQVITEGNSRGLTVRDDGNSRYYGGSDRGNYVVIHDGINNVGLTNYHTDGAWHTYRLEMRGNTLRLFIDGTLLVQGTDSRFATGKRMGIYDGGAGQLKVRAFKVIAL